MKSRKNNINRPAPSRRLLLQLLAMMALTAAPSSVYAQSLGFHKEGQSGLPLDSRGMQQTAEWHYNYYMPANSNTMDGRKAQPMTLSLTDGFVGMTIIQT